MFLQERINQEAQLTRSGQKETMQEVMEREEHTVNEIVKLKEDIEGLTHSLKVYKRIRKISLITSLRE